MSRKIAAFIRRRRIFLLVPATFMQGQRLFEGGTNLNNYDYHKKRPQDPRNWTKKVARHMVFEGPRFAIPSILYSPLTAASVFTPISLARSSALIEVYALETRSKALFWSFSETEEKMAFVYPCFNSFLLEVNMNTGLIGWCLSCILLSVVVSSVKSSGIFLHFCLPPLKNPCTIRIPIINTHMPYNLKFKELPLPSELQKAVGGFTPYYRTYMYWCVSFSQPFSTVHVI